MRKFAPGQQSPQVARASSFASSSHPFIGSSREPDGMRRTPPPPGGEGALSLFAAPPWERQPALPNLLTRAAGERSQPLDGELQTSLQQRLGHDFSRVRVHAGPRSAATAARLQARAYTIGNDIHLGAAAHALAPTERRHLLTHEAVHTVQQGGKQVRAAGAFTALTVSNPGDAAEIEAHRIADSLESTGAAPAPDRPDRNAAPGGFPSAISRFAAPQIQRDLTGAYAVQDGTFTLDLKTQSNPGATSGMKGTIKFLPSATSYDSSSIRLLQIVRLEDLTTGKDYVWTGGEADRNKAQTTEDKANSVQPGFFVDHSAAAASPRAAKGDAAVSPYYRDYWPNAANSQDGSKQGKTIKEASLWDYPGWSEKCRFTFETAAKSPTHGYVYASLHWGFTISDGALGKVENEHAKAERAPSKTFGAAVKAFDEFYKNPGASTAPK